NDETARSAMKTAYSPQQLKSRVGTWLSPCVWRCVSRNMSQTRSYSSRADMRDRFFQRDRGRCTFGIVARPRLRPMASWPTGATGLSETPEGPAAGPADGTGAASPAAATAPADGRPLATRFPIFLAVRGPKRPFLPLPAVLLLLLEPREQPGRRTERPELEDDLAMFLVLRHEEHPPALRDDIDRLLERNLVVALPFLATREVEPFHIQEEDSSAGLPHPSFALLDERPLCKGHGLEDDVLEGAVADDLVSTMEDGLVRFG